MRFLQMFSNLQSNHHVLYSTLTFAFVVHVNCRLRPYYLHFPPPVPIIPVPNGIEARLPPYDIWTHHPQSIFNFTSSRSLYDGHIPLIFHTWVKPDPSERLKLHNGTIIYYVAPPLGGFRASSPPTPSSSPNETTSNSLSDPEDFSTISPGKDIERQSLFEDPTRQSGYPTPAGWTQPNIDITVPPPNREVPWGQGHVGFGWPTSTQLYDKLPEITTPATVTPTRNQIKSTTTVNSINSITTRDKTTPTTEKTATITSGSIAANINARYPVSDSVRKFRRIVAQFRAITKKELATPKSKT